MAMSCRTFGTRQHIPSLSEKQTCEFSQLWESGPLDIDSRKIVLDVIGYNSNFGEIITQSLTTAQIDEYT
jgi:hypothetical protein